VQKLQESSTLEDRKKGRKKDVICQQHYVGSDK